MRSTEYPEGYEREEVVQVQQLASFADGDDTRRMKEWITFFDFCYLMIRTDM
jgi:hypothetical protein